jgi:hypothetical protein
MQAQKNSLSALRVSVDLASTKVPKLAECTEGGCFWPDHTHIDDVWHKPKALQEAVFTVFTNIDSFGPPPLQPDLQPPHWIKSPSTALGCYLAQSPDTLESYSVLSHSPPPSSTEYLSPITLNPNPPHVLPQATDHVQHLALPSIPEWEKSPKGHWNRLWRICPAKDGLD